MAWLRLDDKFARHPKVAPLNDVEFRVLVRTLLYCAEYKTKGSVPDAAFTEVPKLTRALAQKFVSAGLLDQDDRGLRVHDWKDYNPDDPTAADRVKRYRDRNAERNDDRNSDRNTAVTATGPRAQAAARGPSPSPDLERTEASSTSAARDDDAQTASINGTLREQLLALGPSTKQRERWTLAAAHEPDRVAACLTAARTHGQNIAAYFDDLLTRGEHPEQHDPSAPRRTGYRFVRGSTGASGTYVRDPEGTDQLPPGYTIPDELPFRCPTCGIRFKTQQKLDDHLRNVHELDSAEPDFEGDEPDGPA